MRSVRCPVWFGIALPVLLSVGCSSSKAVHERGWIGGEYRLARKPAPFRGAAVPAFPGELSDRYRAGMLVTGVSTNSPIAQAGVKTGDLILELNEQALQSERTFWSQVNQCAAGQSLRVRYYREDQLLEGVLVAGREAYRRWHFVQFGLPWSGRFDPWPDPALSLIVAGYEESASRLDLGMPASQFVKAHQPPAAAGQPVKGVVGSDRWRCWLVLFGTGGYSEVLSQEPAPSDAASMAKR